jgi:hypothetical protein
VRLLVVAPGEDVTQDDYERLSAHVDVVVGCNLSVRLDATSECVQDHCVVSDWQCVRTYWGDFDAADKRGTKLWSPGDDAVNLYPNLLLRMPTTSGQGLNPAGAPIYPNGSSGHAAIGLAHYLGTLSGRQHEILLLGFTCTGDHFHGEHVGLCQSPGHVRPVNRWMDRHGQIAASAAAQGVSVRDYTRHPTGIYVPGDWSSIPCLP